MDGQENNILCHNKDNQKMMLIDYEYVGWNPVAMDLANYINEMAIDNNEIKFYEDNIPSLDE